MSIAEESIPKTSSNKKHYKSWFNDDCKTAIRSRKAALCKFNLQPSAENLNNFKIHRAKTRRIIKTSKKTSWSNYVNKLKSSSHNTAVGPDEIHYEFLKQLPSYSLDFLLQAFNEVWVSGKFPTSWKNATIIPIPKPGKDNTDRSNYRPIALTSCLCKTWEHMIHTRLIWFLESNGLITNFQCGFRSKRCTVDHLFRLETFVREAFIKKKHLTTVFFDLEKAYDTTWKYGIMRDLSDFGLKGKLPHFIDNFLSNRKFKVRVGTTFSDLQGQEEGVPQRSILSVSLFSIKINNIVKALNPGVDCSLYVDDFLICYRSKHMHTIERQLQQCLNKIQKCALENVFKFKNTMYAFLSTSRPSQ